MIQRQIKLKVSRKKKAELEEWLRILSAVWNWAIRKIERDAKDGIYYNKKTFQNILAGHSKKVGIPSHTLQGILLIAWDAWDRCLKKLSKKPKLKGFRNKLSSIPFPDPITLQEHNAVKLPHFGNIQFHKQSIPDGKIKCGRMIKRPSGWHLCLFIDADPVTIHIKASRKIGIDPGYKTNLTLSTGEKIKKTKQGHIASRRLAQAQRGKRKNLTARIHERIKNRRKEENHRLSRRLVEENQEIYFSKDNIRGLARKHGKSVAEAGHYQLRQMLSYKCTTSGRTYVEVASKNSTMTCSHCLALTGPTGWAGLSVRSWKCSGCGAYHDRDHNAAINTLRVGGGLSLQRDARAPSGTLGS